MFYRFNQLLGHVVPATQKAALIPQGFKAKVVESASFIFGSSQTKPAAVPDIMAGKPHPAATAAGKKSSKSS